MIACDRGHLACGASFARCGRSGRHGEQFWGDGAHVCRCEPSSWIRFGKSVTQKASWTTTVTKSVMRTTGELEQRSEERLRQRSERRLEVRRQGRAWCACKRCSRPWHRSEGQTLPTDSSDGAASFKYASRGGRIVQVLYASRGGRIVQVCVPRGPHRSSMRPEGAASFKYASRAGCIVQACVPRGPHRSSMRVRGFSCSAKCGRRATPSSTRLCRLGRGSSPSRPTRTASSPTLRASRSHRDTGVAFEPLCARPAEEPESSLERERGVGRVHLHLLECT